MGKLKPELKDFLCAECGCPRVNTPSGSVCHKGHGKIHPHIPTGIHLVLLAIIGGAKRARYSKNQKCWSLEGEARMFKRVGADYIVGKPITAYYKLKLVYLWPLSFDEMQKPRFGVVCHKNGK